MSLRKAFPLRGRAILEEAFVPQVAEPLHGPQIRSVDEILNQTKESYLGQYLGMKLIQIPVALGSEVSYTVPAGNYMRLHSLKATLQTSASSANKRTANFQLVPALEMQDVFTTANTVTQSAGSSSGTLALDGSVQNRHNTVNSLSATLKTTKSPDVIVVIGGTTNGNRTLSISDSLGLTWNTIGSKVANGTHCGLQTWYATPTTAINDSITLTADGSNTPDIELVAWGINGANTSSPLDANASAIASATGSSTTPTVNITTSNANDFIIGAVTSASQNTINVGAGYTLIQTTGTVGNGEAAGEDKIVSATQSAVAVNFTLNISDNWAIQCSAVQAASTAQTVSQNYYVVPNYTIVDSAFDTNGSLRMFWLDTILNPLDTIQSLTTNLSSDDQYSAQGLFDVWKVPSA